MKIASDCLPGLFFVNKSCFINIKCLILYFMGFGKDYPNRKDKRKPYYGSKRFDITCRCHGGCAYCESNRKYSEPKRKQTADLSLKEYKGK